MYDDAGVSMIRRPRGWQCDTACDEDDGQTAISQGEDREREVRGGAFACAAFDSGGLRLRAGGDEMERERKLRERGDDG